MRPILQSEVSIPHVIPLILSAMSPRMIFMSISAKRSSKEAPNLPEMKGG